MKEVIRYVGGGFLAMLVGTGMIYMTGAIVSNQNIDKELKTTGSAYDAYYDEMYYQNCCKGEIRVIFNDTVIIEPGYVDLNAMIQVCDGTGQYLEKTILNVVNENTGEIARKVSGKYGLLKGGIYRVSFLCGNERLFIRIPVNSMEG